MNLTHFMAIIRMRWRMMYNRFGKSGDVNKIISLTLVALVAVGSLGAFVMTVGWGVFLLGRLNLDSLLYLWDAVAALFLFAWIMALMIELQQSEILSLRNLLHLPISLSGAFFLNYTSSLASLTVLAFVPPMLGLCLASALHFGWTSLVTFPLVLSFLWMVTAVSYQLRGWLSRLMENKRRRGTVITITTIVFVMIFQLPNMFNLLSVRSWGDGPRESTELHIKQLEQLEAQFRSGEIDATRHVELVEAAQQAFTEEQAALRAAEKAAVHRTVRMTNAALPVGWLPYGASAAAGGQLLAPWSCVVGMSTIAFFSLALAYRSTLRVYTGHHNKTFRPRARKKAATLTQDSLLEKNLPFLTETQSAITLVTLRSMLRAPEAKMALLTPLIFAFVFGSMMFTGKMDNLPDAARPWFGIGALGMSLIGMVQMMLNMFGLDRHGFRAFVLMPSPRRDVLLGKNLGVFPVAGVLSALLILFMGFAGKMHFTHVVATLLQIVITFSLYFPISNYTSIVAPIGMAVGTMKPVSVNLRVIVIQFLAVLLTPLAVLPAAFALGMETIASLVFGLDQIPLYLLLTVLELPVAMWLYQAALTPQGRFLHAREQAILEVVSKVAD